ncbi:MAG: arginase family protein [Acidimicrobiales bacterium]
MTSFAIIEAPSVLGLFPGGVERLPEALLGAGLKEAIGARDAAKVSPPPYDPRRDPDTGLLNPIALQKYSCDLADATGEVLDGGDVPIVLGGDCSIVLGNLLALRRRGRHGLLFIDGHADFYQPEAEPSGEAASMDLALATGRGPSVVTDLEGHGPLVLDEDVVQFGRRDADEASKAGSQRIEDTGITVIDLDAVRERGISRAARHAVSHLVRPELEGFWVHVDCDALDDAIMPAVDHRLPGGLQWEELETVVRLALESRHVVGIDITIFNPLLDKDGSIAAALVSCLGRALTLVGAWPRPTRASATSSTKGVVPGTWQRGSADGGHPTESNRASYTPPQPA